MGETAHVVKRAGPLADLTNVDSCRFKFLRCFKIGKHRMHFEFLLHGLYR